MCVGEGVPLEAREGIHSHKAIEVQVAVSWAVNSNSLQEHKKALNFGVISVAPDEPHFSFLIAKCVSVLHASFQAPSTNTLSTRRGQQRALHPLELEFNSRL